MDEIEKNNTTLGQFISYLGFLTMFRFPIFISIFDFSFVNIAHSGAERIIEIMETVSEFDENIKLPRNVK